MRDTSAGNRPASLDRSATADHLAGADDRLPASLALCLSHLRWAFVYQRPQHLMSRLSLKLPVVYFEEPVPTDGTPWLEQREVQPGLTVAVPRLPADECIPGHPEGARRIGAMLDDVLGERDVARPVLWYYTPMALLYSDHVQAELVVYDCMDELSAFRFSPPGLLERERELLSRSDVVFTGGRSLYEKKRDRHDNAHLFPSGVDVAHFARARQSLPEAPDQHGIIGPRVGYYGVIDERIDYDLIAAAARLRPGYQWILLGPLAKVQESELPRAANIHYLGARPYDQLPDYLGGWDVAMMPFALNESTAHISPTKTPEYLAGGRPVVSTPVADVVRGYGDLEVVRIAGSPEAFVAAVDELVASPLPAHRFMEEVDPLLATMSWDSIFGGMHREMLRAAAARGRAMPGVQAAELAIGAAS